MALMNEIRRRGSALRNVPKETKSHKQDELTAVRQTLQQQSRSTTGLRHVSGEIGRRIDFTRSGRQRLSRNEQ